jgi:hypothetical protein
MLRTPTLPYPHLGYVGIPNPHLRGAKGDRVDGRTFIELYPFLARLKVIIAEEGVSRWSAALARISHQVS